MVAITGSLRQIGAATRPMELAKAGPRICGGWLVEAGVLAA
jgi:hypothetical protein